MNLHVTWDGLVGPNINYSVQYKPYQSNDPFTTAIQNLHQNFYTISGLPDGFYEVRVTNSCALAEVYATFPKAGKPACSEPVFSSYEVIEDTPTKQVIKVNFDNANIQIKARVIRASDNTLLKEEVVNSIGDYTFTIQKLLDRPETQKVEIANICTIGQSQFVDMGEYSVQQAVQASLLKKSSTCSCVSSNDLSIKFTDSINSSIVYNNPAVLPWGKYEIELIIPKGTCSDQVGLNLIAYSGTIQMKNQDVFVNNDGSFYKWVLSNIDLKTGFIQGSYVDLVEFKIHC